MHLRAQADEDALGSHLLPQAIAAQLDGEKRWRDAELEWFPGLTRHALGIAHARPVQLQSRAVGSQRSLNGSHGALVSSRTPSEATGPDRRERPGYLRVPPSPRLDGITCPTAPSPCMSNDRRSLQRPGSWPLPGRRRPLRCAAVDFHKPGSGFDSPSRSRTARTASMSRRHRRRRRDATRWLRQYSCCTSDLYLV